MSLFKMAIHRRIDGTEFEFQSERIEKFFRDLSNGKTNSPAERGDISDQTQWVQDFKAYVIPNSSVPVLPSGLRPWGQFIHGLMVNNVFNLRILTLVGLGQGVKFKVSLPYSKAMIENIRGSVEKVVSELLTEFSKDIETSITITEKNPV